MSACILLLNLTAKEQIKPDLTICPVDLFSRVFYVFLSAWAVWLISSPKDLGDFNFVSKFTLGSEWVRQGGWTVTAVGILVDSTRIACPLWQMANSLVQIKTQNHLTRVQGRMCDLAWFMRRWKVIGCEVWIRATQYGVRLYEDDWL